MHSLLVGFARYVIDADVSSDYAVVWVIKDQHNRPASLSAFHAFLIAVLIGHNRHSWSFYGFTPRYAAALLKSSAAASLTVKPEKVRRENPGEDR